MHFTYWVISWHQEPQRPQWPQQPQHPKWSQWLLQPHFIHKMSEFDASINPGTKMTYSGLLMWNRSSKIHYFNDFLGCGGQGCYFSINQRVISKKSTTQNSKTTIKPNLTCIFQSSRANWNIILCYGTPCTVYLCQ